LHLKYLMENKNFHLRELQIKAWRNKQPKLR
jgi:hypothetical protein